ncbi:MAG TPA: hypothetical protein PKY71_12010 [Smithellaceae bacterium]|jgi:hypothetical protein|nr:hypothetical protein [Smithellaceae bacterium]HQF85382.1 hypothetical protein [Smithellaceae bacterium]HQG81596.1 hypothetical protein [Smithellaceae bacterium]
MMNPKKEEQKWHELELRINKMINHFMKIDVPAIEHKPRHFALLQAPQANENKAVKNFS